MRHRERVVMQRVYYCINRMSGLSPSNPCDIQKLSTATRITARCCELLTDALAALNFGKWRDALSYANEACDALNIDPESGNARSEASQTSPREIV